MANLVVDQDKLLLQKNITESGQIRTLLETENTFVDKDIVVEINTPAGALTAGATNLTITDEDNLITVSTSEPASGEYITVEGQGSVSASTGGFIAQDTAQDSTAATKYITIQDATFTVDGASVKSSNAGLVGANQTVGTISNAAQTITGGGLTAGAGSASASSDGLSDGSSIDGTSKVALSETNAAGYYKVTVSGSGTVNRAAVTKQVTTAGYMAGDADPVTVVAAGSETSNTATKAYYIQQSTLSASEITPSTSQQTVTIGAGYHHEARTVTVAAMTTATPTTSLADEGLSTYFNEATQADHDVVLTPQYSNTAGYVAAHTDTNNGGVEYYSIKNQTVTETNTTVNGSTATRGTRLESAGWKNSAETLTTATFSNTVASGKQASEYVDISNTSAAPILATGDYFYINAGWTDDLKISLAKLVPDALSEATFATAGYILQGYGAWDADGVQITGSIPTYAGTYTDL